MAEAIAFDLAETLITKLGSFTVSQIGLCWNAKDDLDDLESTVSTIKAVLLDAEERSVTSHSVKVWLQKLRDALYDADDLLDDFSTEALRKDLLGGNKRMKEVRLFFSSSNQFGYGLKMGRKIKAIKARLISIGSEAKMFDFVERNRSVENSFMAEKRQQTHSFEREDEIIGRDDDKTTLLKLVLEFQSEENVYIIPIVGFGGLGKTALAQLVYNDEMVKNHFELMMFACVSDDFNVKVIVANIIKPDQNLEMDELQKQLRDKIDGKKYLLVLDDIWNEDPEKWYRLKKLLMGGAKGSRIIVTTRSLKVAEIANKCESHVLKLKGLSDDDAWSLFKKIAFEQRDADSTNSAFVEVGKQISRRCGGVPLAIRTIASTLSLKKTADKWHSFKENELAKISQIEGDILPTLKLSYDHLPPLLKHCFAYCRLYPKDYEIKVQRLVQLWIAQGFVKQLNPSQSLEEIGFGYFTDLVERCFFQEVRERYPGAGLTCKMHDLIHDLAESVAGTESSIVDSNNIASKDGENYRHISIDPSLIPLFKGKKLRTILQLPYVRTHNLSEETWDFVIANCRCLRALELRGSFLIAISPSIYKLKHLRYLDLSGNLDLKILPKSICKLQNLLALKLDYCSELEELPKKIENLANLTHLGCEGCSGLTHMPRGIGKLTSLETLSMFVVDKDGSHSGADLSELRQLNNLRGELRISNLGFVKNAKEKFKAANLKEKQHLTSLILVWDNDNGDDDDEKSLEDLHPLPNLKELHIRGWRGDAKFPSWLSLLTNLVDIKIYGPNKFKHLPSFAQLPCLQQLVISNLTELEYMDDNSPKGSQGEPQSFFPSLKVLYLWDCPNMKSWWRITEPIGDDSNDDDTTVMGTSTMAFPCLSSLTIYNCPLTSMPLYPSLDVELYLRNTSSRPLKQTIKMNMHAKTPSSSASSLPLSKLKSFHVANIEGLDTHTLDECLQHLTSLKNLTIIDCKEVDLEGMQWEHLINLRELSLKNFPNLASLPERIQHLINLRELSLENLPNLASLPETIQHLINLQRLSLVNLPKLTSLPETIQHLINLQQLSLWNLPKLTSLPETIQHLINLQRLSLNNLPNLASLPEGIQHLINLQELSLWNFPKLTSLPEWIQHLINLQRLYLANLPNLTSLPEGIQHLINLNWLGIDGVPHLKKRCEKDIGADWYKIAHIPIVNPFG